MTAEIQAASIGIPDTFFILMLALVVFGPRRLPEIGRQVGKLMYEFRKASNEFKYQMEEELRKTEEADRRKKLDEENRQLYPALGAPAVVDAAATDADTKPAATTESSESTALTIQPPSIGQAVFRGKTMVQLTEEAEALAEQTRASIASRTIDSPAASSETNAKSAAKKSAAKKTATAPKIEKESKPAAETKAKKTAVKKKAVKNG
jgi:sec-independent protein translocase protein TatB